jgi:poly(3-hydroxybutyrate) depolymerase
MKAMRGFYKILMVGWFGLLVTSGCGGTTAPDVSDASAQTGERKFTIEKIQLGNRYYVKAVPTALSSQQPYKLLLAFHGSGGRAEAMQQWAGFERSTAQNAEVPYIVAYLQSEQIEWNEGCNCNIAHRLGADDLGFVDAVVGDLKRQYNIQHDEIYAAGFSQGGLFAQNVACHRSDLFKAVAVVAAPMSVQLSQLCEPKSPISIMMLMATDDPVLPYYGKNHPNFGLISAPAAIELFAKFNKSLPRPIRSSLHDGWLHIDSYTNGTQKAELYTINQGGHQWAFKHGNARFDATEEILKFFNTLEQPRVPPGSARYPVNEVAYHVRSQGLSHKGPAIIMLAGPNENYHSDSAWFSLLQPMLAQHARVHVIDRLGNGWSDYAPEVSYRRFAQDLPQLLLQLNEKDIIVLSFASGSIAARLFYHQLGNNVNVKGMVWVDPDVPTAAALAIYQGYPVDWYQAQLPALLPHLASGAWTERTAKKLTAERQQVQALVAPAYQHLMDWSYFDLVSQRRLLIGHQQTRAREIANYSADLDAYAALALITDIPVSIVDSEFEQAAADADAATVAAIQRWQRESDTWNKKQADVSRGSYIRTDSKAHLVLLEQPDLIVNAVMPLLK